MWYTFTCVCLEVRGISMAQVKNKAKEKSNNIIPFIPEGDFYFTKGVEAFQNRKFNIAVKWMKKAIEAKPNDPLYQCQMSVIYTEIGAYHAANQLLTNVLQSTEYTDCYYLIANNYAHLGLLNDAEKYVNLYLETAKVPGLPMERELNCVDCWQQRLTPSDRPLSRGTGITAPGDIAADIGHDERPALRRWSLFLGLGREQQWIALAAACIGRVRRFGFRDILGVDGDDARTALMGRDHHPHGLVLADAKFRLQDQARRTRVAYSRH